jgi:hypothetical protein
MNCANSKVLRSRWLLILFAATYGVVMLDLDGRPITDSYSPTPYHRYQAMALLHGHLALGDSIGGIQPGLAWHDGHVQQVWGLGIALWLLPFEALWRLFGGSACPERIALACAFFLLGMYTGATGLRLIRESSYSLGLATLWLVLLCPALWTLARASQIVFEETVLYAVIVSLAILVSIIRVAFFQSRMDYLWSCALAAFAAWVRPTHAIYGLCALGICSGIIWRCRGSWKELLAGWGIWISSTCLLACTNWVRFGSASEFGHHLTISTENMVYLTRFGNPFQHASAFQAAKELFGLLFLAVPRGLYTFASGLFPGQSPLVRWRRLDLTAFDPAYALLTLSGLGLGITRLVRQRACLGTGYLREPQNLLCAALLFWSGVSFSGMFCFYLYYPAIASRYLFDFAPALTGFVMLVWACLPARGWQICGCMVAVWQFYEIVSAQVPAKPVTLAPGALVETSLRNIQGASLPEFNGRYDLKHHPALTDLCDNGQGWDPESGIAADLVSLAVDKPRFVELLVSARREVNGERAREDTYQAQMDGIQLPLRSVRKTDDRFKVVFDVPKSIQDRHDNEILFVCFSSDYDDDDRESERFLYSARWR